MEDTNGIDQNGPTIGIDQDRQMELTKIEQMELTKIDQNRPTIGVTMTA